MVQYGTVRYSTVEYGTVPCISVQYSAVVILKNSFQFFIIKFPGTLSKLYHCTKNSFQIELDSRSILFELMIEINITKRIE